MFSEYADKYLKQGFSIFPAKSDKKPAIPAWAAFQTRLPSVEEIEAWSKDLGDMNIAIVCGHLSDLTVIDCDTPQAIQEVEALLPEGMGLPIVTTPRGGRHYYFRYCPELHSRNRAHDGIDVKSEGGYVLAPPSKTESGVYTWNSEMNLDTIPERPPVPDALLALLKAGTSPVLPSPDKPILMQGSRDQDLFHLALQLFKGGRPRDEVERIIVNMAKVCTPPFPEKEGLVKVESAWKYYSERNPQAPICTPQTATPQGKDFDPDAVLMTGAEMQSLDIHVDWTVNKLIPERGLTLIYGPGGVGKTWLALAIAKAISTGTTFLGLPTKQKSVFYIDRENPWPLLIERVRKMDIRDVRFWHLSFAVQPPKLDTLNWEIYKKLPTGGLVFFDTARSFHDGDENSSQDAALVMNRLKELRERDNTIVLLHHTSRANERASKGSTAWEDLSDQALAFHRVRRGSFKEIKEEIDAAEFDPDALYHFGTGRKTRYEAAKFYITANYETGEFTLAEDPGAGAINTLAEYIAGEGGGQNQSEIIAWAKGKGVGPSHREAFTALLNRGEREGRWRSHKGLRGAKFYEPST